MRREQTMMQQLKKAWAVLMAAQERRAQARMMRHLDARMLKDIGLEPWNSELARRADVHARQDALAWRADLSFGGLR
jgi:hypothetical protein